MPEIVQSWFTSIRYYPDNNAYVAGYSVEQNEYDAETDEWGDPEIVGDVNKDTFLSFNSARDWLEERIGCPTDLVQVETNYWRGFADKEGGRMSRNTYEVVIRIAADDEDSHPALWNWNDLLDSSRVEFVSAEEIDYEIGEAE